MTQNALARDLRHLSKHKGDITNFFFVFISVLLLLYGVFN